MPFGPEALRVEGNPDATKNLAALFAARKSRSLLTIRLRLSQMLNHILKVSRNNPGRSY